MLVASNFLLWIVLLLLVVAVAALARQIGVLHERIAPMGALVADGGPRPGDLAPPVTARTIDGQVVTIGTPNDLGQSLLLLFVAPDCPICKKIIPIAMVTARAEKLKLIFVGDGEQTDYLAMRERFRMTGYDFLNSAEVGLAYHIGKLPSAVLIRPDGTIAAKGLVNSREHLESLVVANETGHASAQAYLRSGAAS